MGAFNGQACIFDKRQNVSARGDRATTEERLAELARRLTRFDGWLHEIKHDGFRIMARRDGAGVQLITRNGHDFTRRFPLAAAAVQALPGRSFLIDGEAIVTISACQEVGTSLRPWHPSRRLI